MAGYAANTGTYKRKTLGGKMLCIWQMSREYRASMQCEETGTKSIN